MSILVAVMLPSLLCVPMTLILVPALIALAATVLPAWVYRVLAVVWIVTVLPLDVLATIILPFTLDTVIASHGPCALGVAASDWSLLSPPCVTACALLSPPCAKVSVWALLAFPDVTLAACVVLTDEPMIAPAPRASMRAKARPPIRSHLRPRRREGGGWPDRVETISSYSSIGIPPFS